MPFRDICPKYGLKDASSEVRSPVGLSLPVDPVHFVLFLSVLGVVCLFCAGPAVCVTGTGPVLCFAGTVGRCAHTLRWRGGTIVSCYSFEVPCWRVPRCCPCIACFATRRLSWKQPDRACRGFVRGISFSHPVAGRHGS